MAKKIILTFTDTVQTGLSAAFNFEILINGTLLVFSYGTQSVNISFNPIGDGETVPTVLEIGTDLNDTILKLQNWLNTYYESPILSYTKIGDTLEVYIDHESSILQNVYSNNLGIVITDVNVNPVIEEAVKLKYFFSYKNIANDEYRFEIYQVGYLGLSTEIFGRAEIQKASVKDHLDPIRGTSVNITVEASEAISFEDLYTQKELDFPVKLYRNGKLIFRGFLNPDGVYQSFTSTPWQITFACEDGLGAIDNLSFVTETGLHYVGKMKIQDIIFNCLRRTGMLQKINTSVTVVYDGYEDLPDNSIFESVYLNANGYIKGDQETLMSCGAVLRSILTIFNAVITQENGEWYIFRPNDIYPNGYIEFKKYNVSNAFERAFTRNLNVDLGSQIDGFSPYHCNKNQDIQIRGSVSAFRINYKYSFDKGLIENPDLAHDNLLIYPFWDIDPVTRPVLLNDPLDSAGLRIKNKFYFIDDIPIQLLATSESVSLLRGDSFEFQTFVKSTGKVSFLFRVRLNGYYLGIDGNWYSSEREIEFKETMTGSWSGIRGVRSAPMPEDGEVFIEILVPFTRLFVGQNPGTAAPVVEISSANLLFNTRGIVGEFITVERSSAVSSIVKDTKVVANGDNERVDDGDTYVGALYKSDADTLTSTWHRKGFVESKPLLRICAEDNLRIAQRPTKIFKGDFFGYVPFLSLVDINNINGVFMPIEYTYNTYTNIGSAKMLQLFSNELPDIIYKFTYDYGETVKPTITG